jgi:putative transposase
MAYSADLGKRVLDFVAEGGRKTEAARLFRVARSTVFEWLKEGSDHVPGILGPKDSQKIDRQRLRKALEAQPDLMLGELSERFGVGVSTVHYNVQRLGLRRKKNSALRPGQER